MSELEVAEMAIEAAQVDGRKAILTIGRELANIKDNHLYKSVVSDFNVYCQQRWGFSGTRGAQLADHYKVAINMAHHCGMLEDSQVEVFFSGSLSGFKEGHSRELKKVLPAEQPKVWDEARNGADVPTTKAIAHVVSRTSLAVAEEQAAEDRWHREHDADVATKIHGKLRRTANLITEVYDPRFAGLKKKIEDAMLCCDSICGEF